MYLFKHKYYQVIYFIQILFLVKAEINYELGEGSYSVIYIQQKIIYIKSTSDDNNIYYHDEVIADSLTSYPTIKNNKDIIKIDENYFSIVGFDDENYFSYVTYKLSTDGTLGQPEYNGVKINRNIKYSKIIHYNFRCTSITLCILSLIEGTDSNTNFHIFLINLNSETSEEKVIPSLNFEYEYYNKKNIQCEFFHDGNNFLCIINGEKNAYNNWINYYLLGKKDSSSVVAKQICVGGNCFLGNIIKVDNSSNKMLFCYETINNQIISIICQYYKYENNILSIENSVEVTKLKGKDPNYERPLILQIYKNSLFIEGDFISGSSSGILIMSSLDFKINVKSNENMNNEIKTSCFFNNDKFYYILHIKLEGLINFSILQKKNFISASNEQYNEYTMMSNNQEKEINELFSSLKNYTVGFSLDNSNNIYKDGKILDFDNNQFQKILDDNSKYKLVKKIENGILYNYYYFGTILNNDIFSSFSLINQMKVIICYKTCSKCNSEIISTSNNHSCSECEKDYHPINDEKNKNPNSFNCYSSTDKEVSKYYLKNNVYLSCHYSCATCKDDKSCNSCIEGYYFKLDKNGDILYNEKCLDTVPESYFFDYNANIKVSDEIYIKSVYKPCYNTCKSCSGQGNYENNACITCNDSYVNIYFDKQQCTHDYNECLKKKEYWKYENNNIICIKTCDKSFVISGQNKGQCVDSCNNYINPFSIEQTGFLLNYQCNDINYCIPYSDCYRGLFYISDDGKKCERKRKCINIDIFDPNVDPFEVEEDTTAPVDYDDKINDIGKRLKIVKIFIDDEKNNWEVLKAYNDLEFIKTYNTLFLNEFSHNDYNIYLVTSTQFINYTVTIFPLDISNFTYNQVFLPNYLGFVNFTKMYPNFVNYEIINSRIILVSIIESRNQNSSINDLNYFLYSFNEKNGGNVRNLGEIISLDKDIYLVNVSPQLEIEYPLFNYVNTQSSINKRNTENLVNNIKSIYERYPEIELYNITDPFYNDICYLFTSDVGTDMTLNDRRNEYYINISLCENNCSLIKIIDRDTNPRAVCNCDIKYELIFDNKKGLKDNITSYSVQNSKSFICISSTFNYDLKKNGNFWLFVIILIIQIYLLIIYIRNRNNIINKMLGLYDNIINKKIAISDSSFSYEYNNNNNNYLKDKIESMQEEILSAPVNVSNPPKKKIDLKGPNNTTTKTDIKIDDKELISRESSIKGSTIRINERNQQDYTEISFDDLQDRYEPFKIDNLIDRNNMLKDNYIKNPLYQERLKKMKKIKKSLRPLGQKDLLKYNNTCEDVLYSNQNKDKFNNKKNKKITTILGGQEIFRSYLIENYSEDENKPRYPKTKIKNNEIFDEEDKGFFSDEQIIFPSNVLKANHNFLIDEGNNKNKILISQIKNADELFNLKNASKYNNTNTLAKSLGKKEINTLKEEEKNNDERLKTEIDLDINNKIKNELQNMGKLRQRPESVGIFGKNRKRNNNISIENDSNILINAKTAQPLKLIDTNTKNNNDKNVSKESDSKRVILKFQEEGKMEGDMAIPNLDEDKLKRKRSRNLALLRDKNFFSSITELMETNNQEILVEDNFILYFWKYFMKREIWILAIINKKENIPYFVRYSSLIFSISFIFVLNCFLFLESDVHNRYINALSGGRNGLGYYFRKEFGTTICVSLLADLFKMIIIKLVIYKLFKINESSKRMMRQSAEKGLNEYEIEKLQLKRQNYMKNYHRNLLIYFITLMCLNVFIAYICICYGGVFTNSIGAFIYGLLFSLIFSFIFCGLFCLIIVSLYRLGKYLDSKCLNSAYIVLSTLY